MGETLLMRQAGEPSVEEILESIKKVIARDTREEAAQHRTQRERSIPAAPAVAVPQSTTQPQAAAEPELDETSVLELTDAQGDEGLGAFDHDADTDRHDDDPDDLQGTAAMDEDPAKPLVAETAVASMRESLAALALLSQPGAAPQIVRSGETSLEGLTRDLLRPMLADWLERNLPAMVERLVAVEIARIAGKKG
jgi:cell pole-organizing protein PopZ